MPSAPATAAGTCSRLWAQMWNRTSLKRQRLWSNNHQTMRHLVPRRERTKGDVTPKSEPSQTEVKEEPEELKESEEPASSEMRERLRRALDAFPQTPSSQNSESSELTPRHSELPRRSTDPCAYTGSPDPYAHLFHRTIWMEHDRDAVVNEDPVTQIRGELWTTQANLETLRTRVGEVEGRRELVGLREGQQALATRISEVEQCISVHHVREFMRRLIQLESRIGNIGGILWDTLRHCLMKLEQCATEDWGSPN